MAWIRASRSPAGKVRIAIAASRNKFSFDAGICRCSADVRECGEAIAPSELGYRDSALGQSVCRAQLTGTSQVGKRSGGIGKCEVGSLSSRA